MIESNESMEYIANTSSNSDFGPPDYLDAVHRLTWKDNIPRDPVPNKL